MNRPGPGSAKPGLRIAIVAFDGFDDLGTFLAAALLSRLSTSGWKAEIAGPAPRLTSMTGLTVEAQRPLEFANEADVVVFAPNRYARAIAVGAGPGGSLLDRLQLDPLRQTIGADGSGSLLLARLGLLADMPAAADAATRPWLLEAGVRVEDAPFHARGPIATSGGALGVQYLAAWAMVRRAGWAAATQALRGAAPAGEQEAYVERLLAVLRPFVDDAPA